MNVLLSKPIELRRTFSHAEPVSKLCDILELRVRYSETDQMGTFYNARALEWFECGRSELMRRRMGMSYADMEQRGAFLPLVEAHLEFLGGAKYDDPLRISSVAEFSGRARLRFGVEIHNDRTGKLIVRGYTVHAYTDATGRPIKPPAWFVERFETAAAPLTAAPSAPPNP
jgi:acyl-CoA thioester hydrolase